MATLQQNAMKDAETLAHLAEETRSIDKRVFDFQDSVSRLRLTFPADLDLCPVFSDLVWKSKDCSGDLRGAINDFRQVMLSEIQDRRSPTHERIDKLSKWIESLRPQVEESKTLPSQFRRFSEDIAIHARSLRDYEESEAKAIDDHQLQIRRMVEGFNTAIEEQSVSGCSTIISQIGGALLPRNHSRHNARNVLSGSTPSSSSNLAHDHYCGGREGERYTNSRIGPKQLRRMREQIDHEQQAVLMREELLHSQTIRNTQPSKFLILIVSDIEVLSRKMEVFHSIYRSLLVDLETLKTVLQSGRFLSSTMSPLASTLSGYAKALERYQSAT
ncbi:hypothetical protein QCA50_013560 [Cerrena zonata]|uniref:Uncharacterized protein n=1 Tax=Cerrena zonata TaxID=2478898 RepID=A0AAW0G063_9APHY